MNPVHAELASMVVGTFKDGPRPLQPLLAALAPVVASGDGDAPKGALEALLADDPNAGPRLAFGQVLRRWDHASSAAWAGDTEPNTPERRALIYSLLAVDEGFIARCEELNPPFLNEDRPTIIIDRQKEWYTPERRTARSFYWPHYTAHLREKGGWDERSIAALDDVTGEIVSNLDDPETEEALPARGLVVGYVQSGKTANFMGVIARAVDAGYRFIIVFAGTLDILRDQTQRRLDRDLIGWELLGEDYEGEPEQETRNFLRHGGRPSLLGSFDWHRLTGPRYDYRSLRRGIEALEFPKLVPGRPFYSPENLHNAPARILVIKKNPTVMNRILGDLGRLRSRLEDVPALIIDDESDQAGINTRKPSTQARTSTNQAINSLLTLLPRCQYIGYTATPFANVFVDADDRLDIFPRHFIVSLGRPSGYMGISDFFDLGDEQPAGFASKERAYVRDVRGADDLPENILKALDSYILAGAIKLYRQSRVPGLRFRHHTMLVHTSRLKASHADDTQRVQDAFDEADYDGGDGLARLRRLFEEDFLPVRDAQAPDEPMPEAFEDLEPWLGEVLSKINSGDKAVLTVNGDNKDDTPDFEKQPVWKILVGGTKLSRGYTVEGLTVSYYRRPVAQADTLMQMGRWFGFRRGYRDLVRLFIGRQEPDKKRTVDLYMYFRSVCLDEEAFRLILQRYSREANPRLRPMDVPPLVPSHLLPPTAKNKMYHARAAVLNVGGEWKEPTLAPTDPKKLVANQELLADVLLAGVRLVRRTLVVDGSSLDAVIGRLSNEQVIEFLNRYQWSSATPALEAERRFLGGLLGDTGIQGWTFLAPQLTTTGRDLLKRQDKYESFEAGGLKLDVHRRSRIGSSDRVGAYSDPKHRPAVRYLAGLDSPPEAAGDAEAHRWRSPSHGVLVLYPTRTTQGGDTNEALPLSMGFVLQFPNNTNQRRVGFVNVRGLT